MTSRLTQQEYQKLHSRGKKAIPGRKNNKYGAKRSPRCLDCGSGAIYGGACKSCGSTNVSVFDSKAEAGRYDELRLLQAVDIIEHLDCQPEYPISINGEKIGMYRADFSYRRDGALVVEDVKGGSATDTPLSKFKRRCVKACHGVTVTIIRR